MTEIQIIYAASVVAEKISMHSQWPPTSEGLISSAETLKKRRLSSVCASPVSPPPRPRRVRAARTDGEFVE